MVERLKSSVENKFGKKILCQKDCKGLSVSILDLSKEYISPATLRRIFGLLITNSNPSSVTLDILCRYVGFDSWDQFNDLNRGIDVNQNFDSWSRILEKSRKISTNTLDNIKRKSGISFNKTIERQFIEERLSFFLNSNYNSTALIGPGGYGKSITLAKWVEKTYIKRAYSNDIVIFIQAITLNSISNTESYFEDWIMRQIGLSTEGDYLLNLITNSTPSSGRFILIIDALDEVALYGSKLEKVYSLLGEFILKFATSKWFKIIISSRLYAWGKFIAFIEINEKWFYVESEILSSDGANIPLLSSIEIQKILDNTINSAFTKRTLIDEFSVELKDTLSYPYFLQLFTTLYHPENEYLLSDQVEIFKEFLNKQIYSGIYSEEKIDIVNKILELSDFGLNLPNVKKNSLKEQYPIHLKLAGNYHAAYEDLISFGIIVEDDIENKFGGYSKVIRIADSNLFEILIAKSFLDKVEDVSISLFLEVEKKYTGNELLSQLIIRLYQFAYKGRFLKPLMNFFDLQPQTLKTVLSSPVIAITIRKDEYLRKHLLPVYASIPIARKYFFEDFPDYNNITGSFSVSVDYYLKHYDTEEEEIIGLILNVYAGFLLLDEGRVERYYSQLKDFKPNMHFNPGIAGKWFACKLLYAYFLKGKNIDVVIKEAINYLEAIRLSDDYHFGAFESSFYSVLVITNQYNYLSKVTRSEQESSLLFSSRELKLFGFVSKINSSKQLGLNDVIEIDLILSQLNPMDSFMYKVLGHVLKAVYYLNSNEMTNAYDCIRNSIEISNLAGYKIIEVKLMKNLSNALLMLGEEKKSAECSAFAELLTKKTGFVYNLF